MITSAIDLRREITRIETAIWRKTMPVTADMTQRALAHPFFDELRDELFDERLAEHPPGEALHLAEIEAVRWMHDDVEMSEGTWHDKWNGLANSVGWCPQAGALRLAELRDELSAKHG